MCLHCVACVDGKKAPIPPVLLLLSTDEGTRGFPVVSGTCWIVIAQHRYNLLGTLSKLAATVLGLTSIPNGGRPLCGDQTHGLVVNRKKLPVAVWWTV